MSTKGLQIAPDLVLPLDAVTQTIAVLAKRRAGKSYAMRRLVEQLFHAGQQVVLVDPKGDQWGVRSAADGKGPGLPIVILGGERGDVPLEPSGGEVVAKLVVEERVSILLDLSLFRKNEVATFMTGFLENLYRLKAREAYRTPMMLVIDEADAIAPQKPQHGEERMLGAAEDIVRRGGQRGIGCTLVTQRSAVLNKNVLTQAQVLVALRTIAPQDLAAMDAWIQVHGEPGQRKTLMESLPSLPIGDAWFWSPGWPTIDGIFKRVHVASIETFDSGATPKPGVKPVEPKHLADVDLDALTRQMSATIARAKADDPRELRKQIAEKDREIKRLQADHVKQAASIPKSIPAVERVEVPVLQDVTIARLEAAIGRLVADVVVPLQPAGKALFDVAESIQAALRAATTKQAPNYSKSMTSRHEMPQRRPNPSPVERPGRVVRPAAGGGAGDVSVPERRILNALGWWEAAGVDQPTRHQVAFVARYSVNGHFNNVLGHLHDVGLVDYPAGGCAALTDAGRAVAESPAHEPTREELIDRVLTVLRQEPQRRIFAALVEADAVLSREDLANRCRYSVNGHFNNILGSLKSLGVVDYPRGGHAGLSQLFEALR